MYEYEGPVVDYGGTGSVVSVDKMGAGDVSHDLSVWQHLDVLLCLNNMNDLAGPACLERHDGQNVNWDSISIGCCAEGNFVTPLKFCHLGDTFTEG